MLVKVGGGCEGPTRSDPPPTSTVLHFPLGLDYSPHARDSRQEDSRRARRSVAGSDDAAGQREGGGGARNESLSATGPFAGLPARQGACRRRAQEIRRGHPAGNPARGVAVEVTRRAA